MANTRAKDYEWNIADTVPMLLMHSRQWRSLDVPWRHLSTPRPTLRSWRRPTRPPCTGQKSPLRRLPRPSPRRPHSRRRRHCHRTARRSSARRRACMVLGLRHMRTGHRLMVPVERHTQCMSLSVPFTREPWRMSCGLTAETFCFAPAQTPASSWTARLPSVVVDAVELACAGIAHKARGALSGLSGQRHGRWCRVRAASSARHRRRPNFFQPYLTLMSK